MKVSDEIQELIDEVSFRKSDSKDYERMKIEEISREFKEIMKFQQESFRKIEEFEKTNQNKTEIAEYIKLLCNNTFQREIMQIQEVYLKKIDAKYPRS
ncbi:hypothetical protein [Nitrosopumilus sp.]|uniref:hypothetical protein n=1 Tax=Nitrosopumilus sp. TaxID=2024843 RepID=UPI003B5B3BCA